LAICASTSRASSSMRSLRRGSGPVDVAVGVEVDQPLPSVVDLAQ
jgi:hypothetical protein